MEGPSPARILGRYALYDEIAAGGMATVHIGRLLGGVGFSRTVAIKRLHPQYAKDPEFVSMFLDEARLAARIRHPNVVPTLDVVATEGELFLVMEYVQGESLSRLVRAARSAGANVPPEIAATVLVGVLQGLHAAHEARNERGEPLGLVHRDVSPQNVLVGVDGIARVLDFGVAKAAGRVQTTREGQLKGKLPYMAPEQIRGTVSRATDVYAASVVLWETLTGHRLFSGENDAHVTQLVLEGKVVAPSEIAPGVPAPLDAITLRGLQGDPSRRFATAREMARTLEGELPLVTMSRVGEWVEQMAAQALHMRSEQIAAIESSSDVTLDATSPKSDSPAALAVSAGASRPEDAIPTQVSSAAVSVRTADRADRPARTWFVATGIGIAIAVAAAAAVIVAQRDTARANGTRQAQLPSAVPPAIALPSPAVAPLTASSSPAEIVAGSASAVSSTHPPGTVAAPADASTARAAASPMHRENMPAGVRSVSPPRHETSPPAVTSAASLDDGTSDRK